MAFLNSSFLIEKIKDKQLRYFSENYIKKNISEAKLTIFLSHSHLDKELAEGFQNLLAQFGINVYIDWQDSTLPSEPNKETAERIKNKIKELDFFILLATDNSLSSVWCPWEIGIADLAKSYENILIVPIVDDNKEFKGNEYLQLYRRLEADIRGILYVLTPQDKIYNFSDYQISRYTLTTFETFLKNKLSRKI